LSKIESLIGFAIRAGKVNFGLNSVVEFNKNPKLIIFSDKLAESSVKDIKKVASKCKSKLIMTSVDLSVVTHKEGCKVISITDKMFSDGIVKYSDSNYILMEN